MDDGFDDDDYLEYAVSWDDLQLTEPITPHRNVGADESVTEPLAAEPTNGRRRRYRDDGDGDPEWLSAAAEPPRGRHSRGD